MVHCNLNWYPGYILTALVVFISDFLFFFFYFDLFFCAVVMLHSHNKIKRCASRILVYVKMAQNTLCADQLLLFHRSS